MSEECKHKNLKDERGCKYGAAVSYFGIEGYKFCKDCKNFVKQKDEYIQFPFSVRAESEQHRIKEYYCAFAKFGLAKRYVDNKVWDSDMWEKVVILDKNKDLEVEYEIKV